MLIEVRRERKKSSQDLPKRFGVLKESCHFADLWRGEKKKTQLGPAAVTSLDPQFVSDPCALLIEIFNLGVL